MEQGGFGGQYETGMRGTAALRDFGRPMSARVTRVGLIGPRRIPVYPR